MSALPDAGSRESSELHQVEVNARTTSATPLITSGIQDGHGPPRPRRPIKLLGYAPETVSRRERSHALGAVTTSTRWRDYVDIVRLAEIHDNPWSVRHLCSVDPGLGLVEVLWLSSQQLQMDVWSLARWQTACTKSISRWRLGAVALRTRRRPVRCAVIVRFGARSPRVVRGIATMPETAQLETVRTFLSALGLGRLDSEGSPASRPSFAQRSPLSRRLGPYSGWDLRCGVKRDSHSRSIAVSVGVSCDLLESSSPWS